MARATAKGIEIEYDTFGDRAGRPLLLIHGVNSQMIGWPEDFCAELAARGHFVIRFDNRDTGLSTKFEAAGTPDLMALMGAMMRGERPAVPYTVEDMADDSVGLLDALGVGRAHFCGFSMGALIVQTIALRHPARVAGIISIAGSTGNPELPQGKPAALAALLAPSPPGREAAIEHSVAMYRTIAGPGFPFDEAWTRALLTRAYDRSHYPPGFLRKLAAVVVAGNRKAALANVTAPTLVIHGADDPLVPVACGKDTAAAIPGAELLVIDGMGHDLPHGGAWPRIVAAITGHTARAA
jgi:pimeloyl-ACP methyl ester carboxylesterase